MLYSKKGFSKYKFLLWLVVILLIASVFAATFGYFYLKNLYDNLPSFDDLEKYEPSLITKIYSRDGVLLKELYQQNRSLINMDSVPQHITQALVATEDRNFFNHWGFSTISTIRAMAFNIPKVLIGKRMHGASTITQQLARNLYNDKIGFERSIERKIKELLTSIRLEYMYSKKEILAMYFTQCYFGNGAYGVQSGAKKYFGKKAEELEPEESALLIAQLKAPTHYNPYKHPEQALKRRNLVLHNMEVMDYLTPEQYEELKNKPLNIVDKNRDTTDIAPYFSEYVRIQLVKKSKTYGFNTLKDGLKVYTTLDSRYQKLAQEAVEENMPELIKRTKAKFKREKNGLRKFVHQHFPKDQWEEKMQDSLLLDSIAREKLMPEVALLAMDPRNGHILAMVGGTDFNKSEFNRAMQAWRQPGSIFKPILYLTALDNGYNPSTELINQPIVLVDPNGKRWTPGNYSKKNIGGFLTLREALRKSLNLISVRVILELVSPREVITYAKKLGMNTRNIKPYPSIALGSGELRPIDVLTAYGAIANKGTYSKPILIEKILNKNDQVIEENFPEKSVGISEETAFLITSMMKDVVDNGTGKRLRWKYQIKRDIAGKTGTTNNFADTWFSGFIPQLAVTVWVGLDDRAYTLGNKSTGSNTALPIWGTFMRKVLNEIKYEKQDFQMPEGVEEIEICSKSKKRAGAYCPKTYKEYFNKKNAPEKSCDVHIGGGNQDSYDKNKTRF